MILAQSGDIPRRRSHTLPSVILAHSIALPKLPSPTTLVTRYRSINSSSAWQTRSHWLHWLPLRVYSVGPNIKNKTKKSNQFKLKNKLSNEASIAIRFTAAFLRVSGRFSLLTRIYQPLRGIFGCGPRLMPATPPERG